MTIANGHKNDRKSSEIKTNSQNGISGLPASVVVFCSAVLCFVNSYDGDFVFDDSEAVENNQDLLLSTPLMSLFQHDFWGKKLGNHSHKSYRPLTVLTFRWNYWFAGGLHPSGFHLVNIILHGLVSALLLPVFQLILDPLFLRCCSSSSTQIFFPKRVPVTVFLCTLLFAVHPVHTESVAGIVGRADLLCAIFFILSFLIYVKGCCSDESNNKIGTSLQWILFSMLLCCLATFSKELGITVIGICSAFDILYICEIDIGSLFGLDRLRPGSENLSLTHRNGMSVKDRDNKVWLKFVVIRHVILLASALILLTVRWQVMGSSPPTFQVFDNPHSFVNGSLLRAINYNYLYAINAWILVCPTWLCFDWSMGCVPTINSLSDPRLIAVLALWLVVLLLAWVCLCSQDVHTRRALTMGVAFIIIPFLPASNLLFRVGFVIAERVLYLSSAGFCIIVAFGFEKLSTTRAARQVAVVAFASLLAIFISRSFQRSNDWRSGIVLFKSATKVCPLNAKVHYNIAKITSEMDGGSLEQIIAHYKHAIELSPKYDQAMNNLANILKDQGQEREAEKLLDTAITISPDFAAAWMNRGIVKAALLKYEEAEYSYKQALRCRRNYPDCYYNLGNLYVETNHSQSALDAFLNATRQRPTHWNSWNNAIILLDNLGYYEKAAKMGEAALKVLPNQPNVLFSLANVLGKAEKWEESERVFLHTIKVNPSHVGAHLNLGVLYHRWGKLKEAEQGYKKALLLDPNNRSALENYNMLKGRLKGS
ncbi:hypothetical protein RRG08_045784 [Elysia crispata]|uniref:dolichyl-phosphate-mannose--protein mannosyltransferase n=1 Tax=Elysia crispata TaxID=231223 RepID=A0AAE1AZ72_9GAST|nr:hypothetical protein RRG08_045784 [Elysia crispata]